MGKKMMFINLIDFLMVTLSLLAIVSITYLAIAYNGTSMISRNVQETFVYLLKFIMKGECS